MKEWLLFISSIAAGCVRITVCLFLIFRLLSAKKPEKKNAAAELMGAVLLSALTFLAGWSGFYSMALETVWIVFCSIRFQKADARMSMFLGISYEIAVSFWQFLFAAWLGVLFHSPAFMDFSTPMGQIAFWLLHAMLAVLAYFFSRHSKGGNKGTFRFASIMVIAGFLAIITLSEQPILLIAEDTLDMWTILAIVLMVSLLLFNINRQYEAEKELARMKSEQAELLERDYTTLNQAYALHAKLFHDFHNHIGILQQLLSHQKYEEALQYLDELQDPIREMDQAMWTGDEATDYLINSKIAIAKAQGIPLQVQVEFPRHTDIRSADLCAILGNLLDNALEATKQMPDSKQRFIRLTIRRIHQMLVIKVENSFAVPPIKENGLLKTTKMENGLHGWGLKSAQTAAEKYDGTVQTSCTDSTFRAVATLSYQGIPIQ